MSRSVLALLFVSVLLTRSAQAQSPTRKYDLVVKGSDTIGGELGPALAKGYEALHPGQRIFWEGLGSKTAFVGLFDSSADLGASSRPVTAEELAEATRLGLRLQEFVVAYDGEPVIVHPSNHIAALSIQQVSEIFSGKIANWKELGGDDAPIKVVVRPPYSGTRAFFDEKALRRGNAKGPEQITPAAITLEHNHQIVALVAKEPHAIAFIGLASLTPEVRAVPLSSITGGKAAMPEAARIRDGSYPLYRPLFLYTRGAPTGTGAEMIRFVMSPSGQDIVRAIGFVPADTQVSLPKETTAAAPSKATPPVRIFFGASGAKLTEEAKKILYGVAEEVKRESRNVVIVGHADGKGAPVNNEKISRARAKAVSVYLEALDVPPESIKVEAASAGSPIATNDTRAGREKNRRADIFLLPR